MDGYYESLTTLNQEDVPDNKYCIRKKKCTIKKGCCICCIILSLYGAYILFFYHIIQVEDGSERI